MTKEFQQELQEKITPGVKPSDLKKLKRSKSVDDLTISQPNPNLEVQQLQEKLTNLQQSLGQQDPSLLRKAREDLITIRQRLSELFPEQTEVKPSELLELLITKNSELSDHILELRLENIQDFGKYREQLKAVENDLSHQIQTDQSEIKELAKRVNLVSKERTRLQRDKSLAELKLSNLELGESNHNSDWWTDYRLIIISLLTYWLVLWLLSKDKHNFAYFSKKYDEKYPVSS